MLAIKSTSRLLVNKANKVTKAAMFSEPIKRSFFTVITQSEEAYRMTLGKNPVKLAPGFHICLPLIHELRAWDMREFPISVNELVAYTKDNVSVRISGTLYCKIHDAYAASFNVANLMESIDALGTSGMRSVVGLFMYDEIIADCQKINEQLCLTIGNACSNWGTNILKFEIQTFLPANKEVEHQLEKQLEGERNRRKQLLDTESAINIAEGHRRIAILESEGQLIAAKNKADAEKYTIEATTTAFADQIERLAASLGTPEMAIQYLLEQQRLKHLQELAAGRNNTIYFSDSANNLPNMKAFADMLDNKQTTFTATTKK